MEENNVKEIIAEFNNFREAEWHDWVNGVLNNNPQQPFVVLRESDTISILFWVYNTFRNANSIKEQKTLKLFNRTLLTYLEGEHFSQHNSDQAYTLIYYIDNTRLYSLKESIVRTIATEKFKNIYYHDLNLHLFLIKAYSNLDRSGTLIEYLNYLTDSFPDPYKYYVFFNYSFLNFGLEKTLQGLSIRLEKTTVEGLREISYALKDIIAEGVDIRYICDWYSLFLVKEDDYSPEIKQVFQQLFRNVLDQLDAESLYASKLPSFILLRKMVDSNNVTIAFDTLKSTYKLQQMFSNQEKKIYFQGYGTLGVGMGSFDMSKLPDVATNIKKYGLRIAEKSSN
jgi:hypothetical protein